MTTWARWTTVAACVLAAAAGYAIGLAVAGPHGSTAGQWLLDFSKTSGAAAVAAVIAASIAFLGISRQVRAARAQLAHQQDDAASQRWWQSFEWSAARGIPANKEDVALPLDTSINTLIALRDSARSDVQRQACLGLIEELSKKLLEKERSENPSTSEANAWSALARWVSTSTTPASSSQLLLARLSEYEVLQAIRRLQEEQPELVQSVKTNPRVISPDGALIIPDAIVWVNDRPVAIEITNTSDPSRKVRSLREKLKRTEFEQVPILVITTRPAPPASPISRTPVRILQWAPEHGLEPLADALRDLARLAPA